MEAKFILNLSSGTFGDGGQAVTEANIIKIEDFKPVPNFDVDVAPIKTNTKYLGNDVFSMGILVTGQEILDAAVQNGYNSGIIHGLNVLDYVKAEVKITDAGAGDIYGGGFHSLESVFGAFDIDYSTNQIAFGISAADGIIDPAKNYLFNIHYTIDNV